MRTMTRIRAGACALLLACGAVMAHTPHQTAHQTDHQTPHPTGGQPSAERVQRALAMRDKAAAYLLGQQDQAAGGWNVRPDGPNLPAITGLVLLGLTADDALAQRDEATRAAIDKAYEYLSSMQQPDGGIYDRVLPQYNTALSLAALARRDTPRAEKAARDALAFLRTMQFAEDNDNPELRVSRSHPFYGGVGYTGHGRPDNSNLHMFMWALQEAGVPSDDPAVQRALVFLGRTQMDDRVNDMDYAKGSRQGGFVYATAPSGDKAGQGESKAAMIEETLDDGTTTPTTVSRLRAYGSMTYAGFKSYVYAELPRDDIRVTAARDWISRHYTLQENPGLGTAGTYYFLLTFSRALDAFGEPTLEVVGEDGSTRPVNWADGLVDRLAELQNADGSFRSVDDRWMENDPVLVTAYALVALDEVLD